MRPNEIKKLNERIQEYKDNLQPDFTPSHVALVTKKRNQAKRQARKRRGK